MSRVHIKEIVHPDHLHYVASPYSKYRIGRVAAWQDICRMTGQLAQMGIKVFSPIAHGHAITIYADLNPIDHDFWMEIDKPFMEKSEALIVAEMEGYGDSFGVGLEIDHFADTGKPIYFVDPVTFMALPKGTPYA